MTKEEYRAACLDAAYLASCAVNDRAPEAALVERMALEHLYEAADRHLLTGITAMALERAGVRDKAFTQAKGKAIRKAAAFDIERAAVLAKLEEAGIWHMPLKGAVLLSLYPKLGMRQMADNDILCDASRSPEVRAIMEGLGFSAGSVYGRGFHDLYFKPPVCNFEMHRALFGPGHDEKLTSYYQDVKNRLILDEGSVCRYHFSDEDFYIYMLAHEYRHYSGGGTGLRSLLDSYVYLRLKSGAMDWPYISGELDKLGIAGFEARNRSLSLHLFSGETLSVPDREMLDYILSSGTYGTVQNRVGNRIGGFGSGPLGKLRYVLSRLFLPLKVVRSSFPAFMKYPILLPLLPFYRLFLGLIRRKSKLRAELKALASYKKP